MFKKFKERWEAEETAIGKKLKYWIGYVGVLSGIILEGGTQLIGFYTQFNSPVPEWLTHTLVGIGFVGYVAGKVTKKAA